MADQDETHCLSAKCYFLGADFQEECLEEFEFELEEEEEKGDEEEEDEDESEVVEDESRLEEVRKRVEEVSDERCSRFGEPRNKRSN